LKKKGGGTVEYKKERSGGFRLSKATSLIVQLAAESTIDHLLWMMDSSLSIKELCV
jgi:hypothetical protein